ncbi:hypothetical protein MAHJHV63_50000 [Mycobacterium avium subsp. hominissuis]
MPGRHDVDGLAAALDAEFDGVGRGGDDTLFAKQAGAVEFGIKRGRKTVNIVDPLSRLVRRACSYRENCLELSR